MEIRELVKNAIAKGNTSDRILEKLTDLLGKDADGIASGEIQALARTIFDFIIEEVEKQQ